MRKSKKGSYYQLPFLYVQDVWYAVGVWMRRSGDVNTECTGRKLLLHFLHFHHPWWSYVACSGSFFAPVKMAFTTSMLFERFI